MNTKERYMHYSKLQDAAAIRNLRYAANHPNNSVVKYVTIVINTLHDRGLNEWPRIVY